MRAARRGLEPARRLGRERNTVRANLMPQRAPFVGAERVEVAVTQTFLRTERDARVRLLRLRVRSRRLRGLH